MVFEKLMTFQKVEKQQIVLINIFGPRDFQAPLPGQKSPIPFPKGGPHYVLSVSFGLFDPEGIYQKKER